MGDLFSDQIKVKKSIVFFTFYLTYFLFLFSSRMSRDANKSSLRYENDTGLWLCESRAILYKVSL